jgi:hypothetical protein
MLMAAKLTRLTHKIAIQLYTTARHWTMYLPTWIQFTPSYSVYLRAILILSYHLYLGLTNVFFPSCIPSNFLYALLISHACYMPAHVILDLTTLRISSEMYKLWSSSSCKFHYYPPPFLGIRGCIQKFPGWVDKEVYNKHSLRSNRKVMVLTLTRLTHKIAI